MRSQLQGEFRCKSSTSNTWQISSSASSLGIGLGQRLAQSIASWSDAHFNQPEPGDEFLRLSEWPNRLPFAVFRKT